MTLGIGGTALGLRGEDIVEEKKGPISGYYIRLIPLGHPGN